MNRALSLICFIAAVAFAISPLLTPGFNGFSPDQFPVPQVDPPIQPAGWAFSIWGLIYAWLILGTGYGLWRRSEAPDWAPHRLPLAISLALGTAWLPLALISPVWATVLIWIMLATALWAMSACGRSDRWLQQAPVAIYAGWLTAASVVALMLCLAGYDILLGMEGWGWVGLALATGLAVTVQRMTPAAPEYGVTVIWALLGVIAANWGDWLFVIGAIVGAAFVGWAIVSSRQDRTGQP
ncbi:MAG: TspO/MBR family protein [Celeribacter sp.]|jgi:hypothetical protein